MFVQSAVRRRSRLCLFSFYKNRKPRTGKTVRGFSFRVISMINCFFISFFCDLWYNIRKSETLV